MNQKYIDPHDFYWIAVRIASSLVNSNYEMVMAVSSHGVGDGISMWAAGISAEFGETRITVTIPHSNIARVASASVEDSL